MKDDKGYIKRIIGFIAFSVIGLLVINALLKPALTKAQAKETNYSFFLNQVDEGRVTQVKIESNEIRFVVVDDEGNEKRYSTYKMDDPDLVSRLHEHGEIIFNESYQQNSLLISFLVSWVLPIVGFMLIGNLLIRGMSKHLGGNAMSFGKSNAKIYVKAQTGKTFDDVAGQDEAKEALEEIVDFLHNPNKYAEIGADFPKGEIGRAHV